MRTWQKILLGLGASLLLIGALVFVYGYFTHYVPYESFGENGSYIYVDYVAMFGGLFAFVGFVILILTIMRSLKAKRYTGRYR